MASSPLRYKRLMQELPKHNNAKDALIASGFSKQTAEKQSKRVLQSALKQQARDILAAPNGSVSTKQLMSDIVGISSEDLFERIRFIATQDKDLASALKVLVPLLEQHGVTLRQEDNTKTIIPVLNIGIREVNGSVEPPIEYLVDSENVAE